MKKQKKTGLKQFRVRAETYEFYNAGLPIPPYQQCIAFNVAFHITDIITREPVRSVIFRHRFPLPKNIQDNLKFINNISPMYVCISLNPA